MSEYKVTVHTHDPEAAKQLIGGSGLFDLLQTEISKLSNKLSKSPFVYSDSEFAPLLDTDFDPEDPIIQQFFNLGGIGKVKKFRKLKPNEAVVKLSSVLDNLMETKNTELRTLIRHAYNSVQNATGIKNDAIKLEKIAHKLEDKSTGAWQIEALETLDDIAKLSNNIAYKIARKHVLAGNNNDYSKAARILKEEFENFTPSANVKLAYTSLSTQDNEPYLLCPKSIYQSKGNAPVAMEVSKCRDNCIDSRIAKDGTVSCAYQDWLKVAFQTHDQVMNRLNVHRHPDNEVNQLELKEGERSKPLTEGEIPYETRLEKNPRGYKRDSLPEESIEKRLESYPLMGHKNEPKNVKKSQSDPGKVIENQLPRTNEKKEDFLEMLLRKLNGVESDTDSTREEQLGKDSLYSQKGGMEKSFAEQLDNMPKKETHIIKEINNEAGDGDDMSVSQHLNKTAKKQEGIDSRLEDSRKNPKEIDNKETQLQERRTIKKDSDIDATIEELLNEDDDFWGHQYSEAEMADFVEKLGYGGIDTTLKDKQKSNLKY